MSTGLTTSATMGSLLRASEQNTEVGAVLIKKALASDQSLVDTLLPTTGLTGTRLDIRA